MLRAPRCCPSPCFPTRVPSAGPTVPTPPRGPGYSWNFACLTPMVSLTCETLPVTRAGKRYCLEAHFAELQLAQISAEINILEVQNGEAFVHLETSPTHFCSALSSPFVLIIYLFEQCSTSQPELPSTGAQFWKVSVLATNPALASRAVPTAPSGLQTSPSKFRE